MSIDGNIFKEFGVRQVSVIKVSDDGLALMVKFDSETPQSTAPLRAILSPVMFGSDKGICVDLSEYVGRKAFGCRVTNTDEFLIIGFKTRLSSIFPIITMFVAYVIRHDGDPFSKKEKSFIYLIAFITIFFTGPGKYSIDKK